MADNGVISRQIWDVIVTAYAQGGRTKVEVPTEDVVHILLSVLANVLASAAPDTREHVLREIAPHLDRLINAVRKRPNIILPSRARPDLLLPH